MGSGSAGMTTSGRVGESVDFFFGLGFSPWLVHSMRADFSTRKAGCENERDQRISFGSVLVLEIRNRNRSSPRQSPKPPKHRTQ